MYGCVLALCVRWRCSPFPPPACPLLTVLWVTEGGVTGGARRQLDARFHSRLGGTVGGLKQQFVVHELLGRGHVWLLVGAESHRAGLDAVSLLWYLGRPGAGQYMGETGVIVEACQSISLACQARKHSATHSSWRFETATLGCTGSLGNGAATGSISSVQSRFMHLEQWGCFK